MLKKFLIGSFVALVMLVGVTASAADFGLTTLRVGSKGEAVKAVQTLVGATVDGSFGPMTAAKVKAWQANNGLTADGVFGNMSKAKANGAVSGNFPAGCTSASGFSSTTGAACVVIPSTVSGCIAGAAFSSTTGASCAGTVTTLPAGCTTTIGFSSTTGVSCGTATVVTGNTEGYMTLQSAPVAVTSAVNQAEMGDTIMAFAVKAKGSDMKINRVNVSLNASASALPWKYFTNLSLYRDGTLLGTLPVTSTSLTENTFGDDYTAIFGGLNVIVSRDSTANFIVKADIVGTIPSGSISYVVGLNDASTNDVIRGTDAIGLTQYVGKTSGYDRTVTFGTSATGKLTVVANGSTPIAMNVVTNSTNVTTGIPALVFDFQNTSKYDVTVKTINATLNNNNANVSGYYLYDGANIVASVGNPNSTTLSFTNLPSNFIVSANSTKVLSIKMDVGATATPGTQTVSVASTGITAIDSSSNLITPTGTATGNAQTFQSTGVVVNLVSAIATATPSTQGVTGYTTGTIVFKVKANGVNLSKLSTSGNFTPTVTATLAGTVANTYSVSPDTTVSDGSEVTITLTSVLPTATAGFNKFTVTSLVFKDSAAANVTVNTGLDNFYTNSVYAN